jgi:uncharacterized phiE125 gp8 family phage protein
MALDENALVTWAKAKQYLDLDDSGQEYTEGLINAVCASANKSTGRLLKARDDIPILDGTGTDTLILPQYPVNTITKLYSDTERVFGTDTEITSSEYVIYKKRGIIKLFSKTFSSKIQSIKIEYNAGFGKDTDIVPEDLQFAVLEIVAWNIMRFVSGGKGIGVRSRAADGVDTGMEITVPLNAQRTLERYLWTDI